MPSAPYSVLAPLSKGSVTLLRDEYESVVCVLLPTPSDWHMYVRVSQAGLPEHVPESMVTGTAAAACAAVKPAYAIAYSVDRGSGCTPAMDHSYCSCAEPSWKNSLSGPDSVYVQERIGAAAVSGGFVVSGETVVPAVPPPSVGVTVAMLAAASAARGQVTVTVTSADAVEQPSLKLYPTT